MKGWEAPYSPGPLPLKTQSLREMVNFFPRQIEALAAVCSHTFTLYGGAAGGGKSRFLRWLAVILLIRWAKRGHRGVRVGLFCDNYPNLHDRQLAKIRMEFPDWLGSFHESSREFRLAEEYGGGVICFRNLDQPEKYKSAEFAAILVDELTEIEQKVFDFLTGSRMRWPGIEDVKFVGATNPGSIGHFWCKQFWIDKDLPPRLADVADQFAYVKATALDNPHNAASYIERLMRLPDDLRRALFEGDWDIFEGMMFREWRREIHVVPPFKIPSWWTRWMANDPGFKDPSVWYWMAADGDGNVYVYRERTYNEITQSEQGRLITEVVKGENERISFIVTGMDAFVVRDRSVGKTDVDYYAEGGLGGFVKPVHGVDARSSRAKTLHEYLRHYDDAQGRKVAKLRVFGDLCPKLITTLPALPMDESDPDAVKECNIDHWYDALGYGLQAWHVRKSTAPDKPAYEPGSLGDVLNHAKKLGKDKIDPTFG